MNAATLSTAALVPALSQELDVLERIVSLDDLKAYVGLQSGPASGEGLVPRGGGA